MKYLIAPSTKYTVGIFPSEIINLFPIKANLQFSINCRTLHE